MRHGCRRSWRVVLALSAVVWLGMAGSAHAQPPGGVPGHPLADESARVLPRGAGQAAVFQASRVGVGYGLQVESRVLLLGLMPNAALRFQWWDKRRLANALRLQLTYPGVLLRVLAREGALGLLPPDTEPAETVMLDLRSLHTVSFPEWGALHFGAGLEVAPRRAGAGSQPVLDFPFLYPRFAALHHAAVVRAQASFRGVLPAGWGYGVDTTSFILAGGEPGWSVELGGLLSYVAARHLVIETGFRAARSRLPVGRRWHWLPWLDLLIPWDAPARR